MINLLMAFINAAFAMYLLVYAEWTDMFFLTVLFANIGSALFNAYVGYLNLTDKTS